MELDNNIIRDYYLPVILGTIMFLMLMGFFIVAILQYRKTRKVLNYEREIFKNAVLQTQVEIRDQTLNEVSRELHDNIGQIASLIKIHLNTLDIKDLDSLDKEKIEESKTLLKNLILDIKTISRTLNTEVIKNTGLFEALKNDIERIIKTGFIKINYLIEDNLPKINNDVEIFLYRMCQEIFNNILQHSKAKNANLSIFFIKDNLTIEISDNGVGFNIDDLDQPIKQKRGLGLINLVERGKLIKATVNIDSGVGVGTKITIIVPIKNLTL